MRSDAKHAVPLRMQYFDDMIDENENEVKELVERFRRSLRENTSESYFDEDDLIEIFDYAGDHGDDYIRMEVLLRAARFFPESDELWERRAVFYSDVIPESVEQFTADTMDRQTLLTTIISLRSATLTEEQAKEALNKIVEANSKFTDEEVIQIVDFASDNGCMRWVTDNMDLLKSKITYLPTLLYETGAELIDHGDYDLAIPVIEQLVGEMPFNVEYWNLMAEAYAGNDREQDAEEATDTALAIDPENQAALRNKARRLSKDGNSETVKEMLQLYPDDENLNESYYRAKIKEEQQQFPTAEHVEMLKELVRKFPANISFMTDLMMHAPENSDQTLDEYWSYCESLGNESTDTREWIAWADSFAMCGKPEASLKILECLRRHTDPNSATQLGIMLNLANINFRMGNHEAALAEAKDYIDSFANVAPEDIDPVAALIECVSLAKLGRTDEALKESKKLMTTLLVTSGLNNILPTQHVLVKTGVISVLNTLITRIENQEEPFSAEDYNPILIWKR